MSKTELTLLSQDPKDPNYRIRVSIEDEGLGNLELAEEELTSNKPTAQVTELTHSWVLTKAQGLWVADAIHELCGTQSFKLSDKERAVADAFITAHNEMHKGAPTGAIGGRYSYRFTSTSIGMITTVTCACKDEVCLTDLDDM